jgi:hypothetical protein
MEDRDRDTGVVRAIFEAIPQNFDPDAPDVALELTKLTTLSRIWRVGGWGPRSSKMQARMPTESQGRKRAHAGW